MDDDNENKDILFEDLYMLDSFFIEKILIQDTYLYKK